MKKHGQARHSRRDIQALRDAEDLLRVCLPVVAAIIAVAVYNFALYFSYLDA
tara:strand:+ start:203 stop:358 length:156 start_codon:yes stop_codon:yes gene_type:complete